MLIEIVFLLHSILFRVSWSFFAKDKGWNHLNLHCRDNNNVPAEWWFIYKPPEPTSSFGDFGRNFTYLSSEESKPRWKWSDRLITSTNMLHHTLAPIYRPTYIDHLAYMVFSSTNPSADHAGSSMRAVIMADELSALYIGHTVPNLVLPYTDRASFPEEEVANGHMMFCIPLKLDVANNLALHLKASGATVVRQQLPEPFLLIVPKWFQISKQKFNSFRRLRTRPLSLDFKTEPFGLKGTFLTRMPGDEQCLYQRIAKEQKIVLDVYAPGGAAAASDCKSNYGVRNIESISLKTPERVDYIDSSLDKSRFAVSTAAHWQRRGRRGEKYWTCLGSHRRNDDTKTGGLLICVENTVVWTGFDNLKVKEPEC